MQQRGSVYYFIGEGMPSKAIAFDLDWTLTFGTRSLIPREPSDIHLLPGRLEKLTELSAKGWGFVIFTNQLVRSNKELPNRLKRMKRALDLLQVCSRCSIFISTKDDLNRKPNIGMYEMCKELLPNTKIYTYVGDAAGRPQDFSDSDLQFAKNARLRFLVPEKVFSEQTVDFADEKNMVLLMGMPGSGKSTFYAKYLGPKEYIHINQDTLKTRAACLREAHKALEEEKNICIDNTNSVAANRQEFIDLADEYGYTTQIVYLARDGYGWNKLREHPVPDIAYHMYFKKLEMPDNVQFI